MQLFFKVFFQLFRRNRHCKTKEQKPGQRGKTLRFGYL